LHSETLFIQRYRQVIPSGPAIVDYDLRREKQAFRACSNPLLLLLATTANLIVLNRGSFSAGLSEFGDNQ